MGESMSGNSSKASSFGAVGRRQFLAAGSATAATFLLPGCATSSGGKLASSRPAAGTLRLGMAGGSTKDSFDIGTYTDSVAICLGYQVMNGFVEIDAKGLVIPELFESWDVKPGAREWSFKLRSGVTFHNGKSFAVADALYSLNLHRGASRSVMVELMKNVLDVRADGPDRLSISLAEGDADFLYVLGDYHMLVVPDGFDDWSHPIGTGAFRLDMYEPGVRAVTTRQPNYWKRGAGNVQAVELYVINDTNHRLEALRSDQVDVINRVPASEAASIEGGSDTHLVRAPGAWHADMAMNIGKQPFDNLDLRLALKYAVDRNRVMKDLFYGYGHVGNDHPITIANPFYNAELTQRSYDPDKARFHLKKSGMENTEVILSSSDAAFKGAIDMSLAFKETAQRAGIKLTVQSVADYGFWDNTWLIAPFVTSYWGGRPAATQMLSVAYKSTAAWNETNWRRSDFDTLLTAAKEEIDVDKRRPYIWEMQKMLNEEGGAIIPVFQDWLEAHRPRVQNHTPHSLFDFCNGRIAEKVSLSS
jgi:peptide/nickel transport system substrate-binding protein